jgi:hypothetical protein
MREDEEGGQRGGKGRRRGKRKKRAKRKKRRKRKKKAKRKKRRKKRKRAKRKERRKWKKEEDFFLVPFSRVIRKANVNTLDSDYDTPMDWVYEKMKNGLSKFSLTLFLLISAPPPVLYRFSREPVITKNEAGTPLFLFPSLQPSSSLPSLPLPPSPTRGLDLPVEDPFCDFSLSYTLLLPPSSHPSLQILPAATKPSTKQKPCRGRYRAGRTRILFMFLRPKEY